MADDHVVKKSRRINTALIIAAVLVFGVLLFIMIYGKMKPEAQVTAVKDQDQEVIRIEKADTSECRKMPQGWKLPEGWEFFHGSAK